MCMSVMPAIAGFKCCNFSLTHLVTILCLMFWLIVLNEFHFMRVWKSPVMNTCFENLCWWLVLYQVPKCMHWARKAPDHP